MFAVIKTGGKQYKVAEGDVLYIEKLVHEGSEVVFNDVLLVVNPVKSQGDHGAGGEVKVGKPLVAGAKVLAKVLEDGKGDKKMVFRYKSKTRQHKKKGHRQPYTKVQILKIEA
ncbi:MAG: 50S ribosomal protein L21 [Candidatus Omnitrophota bacterium]